MWSLGVVLLVRGVDEHARFEHRVELFDVERRSVVRGVLAAALGPLAGGLLPARREAMTFEAPQALDALSVHRPALLAQERPDRAVPQRGCWAARTFIARTSAASASGTS